MELPFEGDTWEFSELYSYETPIKDGRLQDVVPGDLNGDGRKDLVFLETGKDYVDLVEVAPEQKLLPGNRWPVFEERTLRNRRSDFPEPREAVIADVTGDGRNDLLLLVHDRVAALSAGVGPATRRAQAAKRQFRRLAPRSSA